MSDFSDRTKLRDEETQLALITVPPVVKLTGRRQHALRFLQSAGTEGLHSDELGALIHEQAGGKWAHGRDQRCAYCGQTGTVLLKALRAKGLARYRRGTSALAGTWLADGDAKPTPRGMTDVIPF